MGRYLAQALLHSMVAALAVEALAMMWREETPARRIRRRLLALGAPLLPLFDLVPPRREEWFEERFALLSGRHWSELSVLGVQPWALFVGALATLGAALFIVDVADLVRDRRIQLAPHAEAKLAPLVAELSAALGLPPPPGLLAQSEGAIVLCRGGALVVSQRAVDLLDEQELRG
ncbi:MAG: M56 family metallopeptidase, partial [Myxococcales bacterium]